MAIYAYGSGNVIVILYKAHNKKYLLLTYDRTTKHIRRGQWLKGTQIKHNMCSFENDEFTYVTLNYSSVKNRHNQNGVGYRCTSIAPYFTANKPIEWFKDCWSPLYRRCEGKTALTEEEASYLIDYCKEQQFECVR